MTILTIVMLFISTNVDDLFLLHVWFSKSISRKVIFFGQLIGISILVGLSFLLAQGIIHSIGDNLRRLSLGGLIPLILGVRGLIKKQGPDSGDLTKSKGIFHIIGTAVANGVDNITIYTPFFLKLSHFKYRELGVVFFVMTGFWCVIAKYTSSFTILQKLSPYLLISIGIYILKDVLG